MYGLSMKINFRVVMKWSGSNYNCRSIIDLERGSTPASSRISKIIIKMGNSTITLTSGSEYQNHSEPEVRVMVELPIFIIILLFLLLLQL